MGKLIALLSAGSGTVVVSVGGFYMIQNGLAGESNVSEGAEDGSLAQERARQENQLQASTPTGPSAPEGAGTPGTSESNTNPITPTTKKSNTLNDFKNKNEEGYKCVSSLFDEQDSWFSTSDEVKDFSNFFGNPASDKTSIKSCLIINWEKKTYSDNKWTGKFAWTWSFMNGDKGFVVSNTVDAGTDSSSTLTLNGGAYLLEKKSEGTWEVKYEEQVATDIEATENGLKKYLPKAGSGVTAGAGGDANYWGFIEGAGDLKNICDSDDDDSCSAGATSTKVESKEFEWTWQKDGDKKIAEWSENLTWWNSIYGENTFDLKKNLEPFKGTWSKANASDDV